MFWGYDFDASSDDGYGYGYGYDDDCYGSDDDYGYDYDSDSCYVDRKCGRDSTDDGSRRFENYGQGRELLAELASQRKTGEFLDVVVQVEGREFPCHRAVLSSTPYFKAMLSSNLAESSSEVVQLHGIDSISFSKILDFLYTGEIRIGKDDVQDILQTAHMLQFDKILQYCREFIQDNLCPSNCLGVMRLADVYGLSALKKKARDMATSNFLDVTQDEEFLSLSAQELTDLLRDKDLEVTNEDNVVKCVIRWLDEDPEIRQISIPKILTEIRLSCVRVSMLQKLQSHPVIQRSAECLAKIAAAREKHLHGTQIEGEDTSCLRQGTSDNLAIIVGGWKAAADRRRHLHNEHPIIAQPTSLQSVICFDPDSEQYYHITTLPTPVSGYMSVASAEGHLYVTGGRVHPLVGQGPHSAPSRQAFRYDLPSDTWLRLPDMPHGRAGHQSVVINGKLFLVGGDAEATSLVTVDCYDPEEGAWIKIPVRPPLQTSSNLTVTAFGDRVVFIEVPEMADADDCSIDVHRLGVALLLGAQMGFRIQRRMEEGKLCVHAFDVKTGSWKYADIQVDIRSVEDADIITTVVNDKLHIRTAGTPYADIYVFNGEEDTLNEGDRKDWKENFLRMQSEYSYRYMNGQEGIVDTIRNYEFGDHYKSPKTPLPFGVFGHSFLQTKKSRVGWYCRDLAVLEKEDEREGSDES
ncbi:kelch-like protein 24 [Branchiostoma floridae x Branchiostoma belcheri]